MPTLYIMIGIPGSGKTTYAKKNLHEAVYIGTDAIRKKLYGKEMTIRGWRKIRRMVPKLAACHLRKGRDVVVDCTNITVHNRKRYFRHLPKDTSVVAVFLDTPVQNAIENNRKRARNVPVPGIIYKYLCIQHPSLMEGFAEIRRIRFN